MDIISRCQALISGKQFRYIEVGVPLFCAQGCQPFIVGPDVFLLPIVIVLLVDAGGEDGQDNDVTVRVGVSLNINDCRVIFHELRGIFLFGVALDVVDPVPENSQFPSGIACSEGVRAGALLSQFASPGRENR